MLYGLTYEIVHYLAFQLSKRKKIGYRLNKDNVLVAEGWFLWVQRTQTQISLRKPATSFVVGERSFNRTKCGQILFYCWRVSWMKRSFHYVRLLGGCRWDIYY